MTIVKFEGLAQPDEEVYLSSYASLNWKNFGVIDATSPRWDDSGYNNVIHSGKGVAFTAYAQPGTFSSKVDFDLKSGYFAAAWNNGLRVTVKGFDDGVQVAELKFRLNPTQTLITFDSDFRSIDRVQFTAARGVDADPGDDGSGAHLAIDDLAIRFLSAAEAELERDPFDELSFFHDPLFVAADPFAI